MSDQIVKLYNNTALYYNNEKCPRDYRLSTIIGSTAYSQARCLHNSPYSQTSKIQTPKIWAAEIMGSTAGVAYYSLYILYCILRYGQI